MRLIRLLLAAAIGMPLTMLAPLSAGAAVPPSAPAYEVNLGAYPGSANMVYPQIPMWLDTTTLIDTPAGGTTPLPRPVSNESPLPVNITTAAHGLISLDNPTVTSGTPVNVLLAGHALNGGFITSAQSNSGLICLNQHGSAGTTTSGDTVCIGAGQTFLLLPSTSAVSMNASSGTAAVGGYGYGT